MRAPGIFLLCLSLCAGAEAAETEHHFRVTSLFQPDRVADFRALMSEHFPEITIASLDFQTATVALGIDATKTEVLSKAKTPEDIRTQLGSRLRNLSRGAFDLLPVSQVPPGEIAEAAIPVIGLDCKGCSYGAYRAVTRVEGVEYATASFADGRIVVRFDRRKTSLPSIEAALSQARIMLNHRIEEPLAVPCSEMRIARFSSEETIRDEAYAHSTGHAANLIDGDPLTKWSSRYVGGESAPPPHEVVIDLGRRRRISGFRYLPRQTGYTGHLAKTEFYVGDNPDTFEKPAAEATFTSAKSVQPAHCASPVEGRFVLIRVLSELNGKAVAAAAEIAVIQSEPLPSTP